MVASTPLAITTDALTRRFDTLLAVDHLNLSIASGTIFGLLGPNGAGKSTTIYPIDMMPPWLGVVAHVNPLTYLVDALRTLVLVDSASAIGVPLDFAVLAIVFVALVAVAAKLYPGLAH